MQASVQEKLIAETAHFYRSHASSFADSRERAWEGFTQLEQVLEARKSISLCDVAAGNCRLAGLIAQKYPQLSLDYLAADQNEILLESAHPLTKEAAAKAAINFKTELVNLLNIEERSGFFSQLKDFDLICSYGFLHHVPGKMSRLEFVSDLAEALSPKSYLALSLWSPLSHTKLAERIAKISPKALEKLGLVPSDLEVGDVFLAWRNDLTSFRYIHSFSEADVQEIIDLCAARGLSLLDERMADAANYYLLFEK